MEAIFHEQQEGSLCAQHCLNSLLQGQFYSAVDLADIAQDLDGLEQTHMAAEGDSEEYRRFMQQPSTNMDDSGFFSVQVISKALEVWGLELISFTSADPLAERARQSPLAAQAYICNYQEHWFTIRRLGQQWFNLNSLLEFPELVSNTYLGEFLAQLQQEGYSIFIIKGQLPECDADLVLQAVQAVQARRPNLLSDVRSSGAKRQGVQQGTVNQASSASTGSARDEEADLEAAMMLSLAENVPGPSGGPAVIDEDELQMALAMSQGDESSELEMALALSQSSPPPPVQQVSEEDELQQAISLSLAGGSQGSTQPNIQQSQQSGWGGRLEQQEAEEEQKYLMEQQRQTQEEEEELKKALALSLEGGIQAFNPAPSSSVNTGISSLRTQSSNQRVEVDPVRIKAPAGSSISDAASKSSSVQGTSGVSRGTSAGKGGSASVATSGPQTNVGGHTLGGGSTSRPAGGATSAGEADPAEIRRRRLAFLEKMQKDAAK